MSSAPPPAPTSTAFGFSLGGTKPAQTQPVAPAFSLAPAKASAGPAAPGDFDLDDLDSLLSGNTATPAQDAGVNWADGLGMGGEEEEEEGDMPQVDPSEATGGEIRNHCRLAAAFGKTCV